MANVALRLAENVAGDFFVASTCIDCDACRQIAPAQTRSMKKLLSYDLEWVLPGHGRIHQDSYQNMRAHLARCIEWMKTR